MAGRGARRHRGHRLRAPAGAAVAAHDGRADDVRPVRRRGRDDAVGRPAIGGVNPDLVHASAAPSSASTRRQLRGGRDGPDARRDAARVAARRGAATAGAAAAARPRSVAPGGARGRGRARRPARWRRDPRRGHRAARARGPAAGDHLHLQPGRLRGRRRPAAGSSGIRLVPEARGRRATGALVEERVQGLAEEDLVGARLLGLRRRALPRVRRPPRRHAADVPRDRRGAVHRRPDPGRLRHRDAGPRHQHAGAHRRAREAGQVQRRDPRRHHARPSTPSSPGGPAGAASTSRVTPSSCGTAALDPLAVAGLASTRTYPLRSSFRPTYNMAVNLVAQFGRETRPRDPRDLVRPVPGRPCRRGLRRAPCAATRRRWRATPRRMTCHLGDFSRVRRDPQRDPRRREGGRQGPVGQPPGRGRGQPGEAAHRRHHPHPGRAPRRLRRRRPAGNRGGKGEARVAGGRHRGPAAAPADPGRRPDARSSRSTHVSMPQQFNARNAQVTPRPGRHRCGSTCRTTRRRPAAEGRRQRRGRADRASCARQMQGAPVPPVPRPRGPRPVGRALVAAAARDRRHAAQGRRPHQLGGRTFDRICDLLDELGYLAADGTAVTAAGETLRRLYTEKDLLAAECLRARGLDAGSTPPASRRPCRRWSTSRAATRPSCRRGCRTTRSREAYHADDPAVERAGGPRARPRAAAHRRAGRRAWRGWCTAGPAASASTTCSRTATWPPVTSSAGASRSSTCWARSPTRRRSPRCAATARKAVDAVMRGVVAADRLD